MDILEELEEISLLVGGGSEAFKKAAKIADYLLRYVETVKKERNESQSALDDLSKRFTALIQQNSALAADNERLTEELIRACAELSGIKKQEPCGYLVRGNYFHSKAYAIKSADYITENHENCEVDNVYKYPVHQHSFTLSGIGTFYADSELEITYLERLHGVGGKANLKAVDEEHF